MTEDLRLDLTEYGSGELSLYVYNDEYLYHNRFKSVFVELIEEYYIFTPEQLAELQNDLAEEQAEEELEEAEERLKEAEEAADNLLQELEEAREEVESIKEEIIGITSRMK